MSQTLAQSIADTLRHAIQHGTYGCGDRLVELTLSQELDVSQNTIRDALHILEQEGWVNKIPRRGVYIPSFTMTEAEELYALWQAVEDLALRLAIDNMSDTERSRLRETIIAVEHKVDRGDNIHAMYTIYQFHTVIVLHANAPRTETILHRIHNQVQLLEIQRIQRLPLNQGEWDTRMEHYFDLLHEIDQHNTDKASSRLKQVLQYEAELILPFIK